MLFLTLATGIASRWVVVSRLDMSAKVEASLADRLGRPPSQEELELAARTSRVSLAVAEGLGLSVRGALVRAALVVGGWALGRTLVHLLG